MSFRIKDGKFLIRDGKFAVGADGSPCGCCGEICKIHALVYPLQWELRQLSGRTRSGPSNEEYAGTGQYAIEKKWEFFGELPSSGGTFATDLPISVPEWKALLGIGNRELGVKRWVPAWDTRSYLLTLSISGTSLVSDVLIDHWHTFNGFPYDPLGDAVYGGKSPPSAQSWGLFFSLSATARPYGCILGSSASLDYDALPAPSDYIIPTGGSATRADITSPAVISSVPISSAFGAGGASGGTLVLSLSLGASPSISLSSYSALRDTSGVVISGAELVASGFPVTLANDHANLDHSFSVSCDVKSGGVTVGSFTASGIMRRNAWGAITRAAVTDSATQALIFPAVGQEGGLAPGRTVAGYALNNLLAAYVYPWSCQYELGLCLGQTLSYTSLGGGLTRVDYPATATVSMAVTSPAAAEDYPSLSASGALTGTILCPGTASSHISQIFRPFYAELVEGAINRGVGFSLTPSNHYIYGVWEVNVTTDSDVDLSSKYPAYDSVTLPAGTVLKGKLTGNLRSSWVSSSFVYVSSGFASYSSVTLNAVLGGVPTTFSASLTTASGSSNPNINLPATAPSIQFEVYQIGWGSPSVNLQASAANLSVHSLPNKTGEFDLGLIASAGWQNYYNGVVYLHAACSDVSITYSSPKIDSRDAQLVQYSSAETKIRPLLNRGANTVSIDIFESPSSVLTDGGSPMTKNVMTEFQQLWVCDSALTQTLVHLTDIDKTYGKVRLVHNGCELPSTINVEDSAVVDGTGAILSKTYGYARGYHQFSGDDITPLTLPDFCDNVSVFRLVPVTPTSFASANRIEMYSAATVATTIAGTWGVATLDPP